MNRMKVLVVIASYGRANDRYLWRLVQEYQSTSFAVDLVVCTNVHKAVPAGVELVVGLPAKDPWSLPFAHKRIFADRAEQYDLFIYSEDDTLATERNIQAFLRVSEVLPPSELPGFIRYEEQPDGTVSYCDVNGHYHWEPSSVVQRGEYAFAYFTNEHSALYMLTAAQLNRCVQSGGFLVPPHRGKYDLACTAATDPYTQCGFRKLLCISCLEDFRLHHLPNKYVGTRFGTHEAIFHRQIGALMLAGQNGASGGAIFRVETRLRDAWYSKDYYEPVRPEVVGEIPVSCRKVLSVGCGAGKTEKWLAARGAEVTAICLDRIIGACAQGDGVVAVWGDLGEIRKKLMGRSYDCVLFSNVLQLAENPAGLLAEFGALLEPSGYCVILLPNLRTIKNVLGKLRGDAVFRPIGNYEESGTREIRVSALRHWLAANNVHVSKRTYLLSGYKQKVSRLALGVAESFLANEILVVGRKASN
jgi:2-polyprenyl-3-methyl-5-hydroxy-6-metoxy-1,4-benzoquinol methylase